MDEAKVRPFAVTYYCERRDQLMTLIFYYCIVNCIYKGVFIGNSYLIIRIQLIYALCSCILCSLIDRQ